MAPEIELRAPVEAVTFGDIVKTLRKSNSFSVQQRCFVDFSTLAEGVGNRRLDVRLRVTNGRPEFIVKRGQFGALVREEATLAITPGQIGEAATIIAMLYHPKGVLGVRRITRGMVDDVEVSLQEVLDWQEPTNVLARLVEVEYKGNKTDTATARKHLKGYLSKWKLKAYSMPEWNSFVEHLNEKGHGTFVCGETPPKLLLRLGSLRRR